jgi:hypothetical protein
VPQKLTLCRWSLRVRSWAITHYGAERLAEIFKTQNLIAMGEISYYMLKEKELFPTLDAFLDAVCTPKDHLNMVAAMLGTLGIAEPKIEEIREAMKDANAPKQKPQRKKKKPIGAKSLTP